VFRDLALQKESRVEEGHLMADHVHMLLLEPSGGRRIRPRHALPLRVS